MGAPIFTPFAPFSGPPPGLGFTQQIAPLGTGADDWPRLQAFIAAHAAQGPIEMRPGVWHADSDVSSLPSGTILLASPGVRIVANLPIPPGGPAGSVFRALWSGTLTTTTTTLTLVPGLSTLHVTSAAGFALGDDITLANAAVNSQTGNIYTIKNIAGLVITVDRPILRAYPAGSKVTKIVGMPRNVHIFGNGMQITGTANRAFEMGCADSFVSDVNIDGVWGDAAFSWEISSYRCLVHRVTVVGGGAARGIFFESSEECAAEHCFTSGCLEGFYVQAGINCTLTDCHGSGNNNTNFRVGSDDNLVWTGAKGNKLIACEGLGAAACFYNTAYSEGTELTACRAFVRVSNNAGFHQDDNAVSSNLHGFTLVHDGPMGSGAGVDVEVGVCTISGLEASGLTGPGGIVEVRARGTGEVYLSGFDIIVAGPGNVWGVACTANGAYLSAEDGKVTGDAGTTYAYVSVNAAEMLLTNCRVGAAANQGFYAAGAGGRMRLTNCDPGGAGTGFNVDVAGNQNRGTFALNGATPVNVVFPGARAGDIILLEKTANGGTPGAFPVIAITPGTGFAATGQALDTSTYAWRAI